MGVVLQPCPTLGGVPSQVPDGRCPILPNWRYPILPNGGYPILPDRGIPSSQLGGTPSGQRRGLDGGIPHHWDWMGVPLAIGTGWGYPQSWDWMGVPPHQDWIGYPLSRTGWGTPPLPHRDTESSMASSCYTAEGMPLAFTQEEFLVKLVLKNNW